MKITIPFKTPTINHLYYHRGNIKILKTEARELQKKINDIVQGFSINHGVNLFSPGQPLKVVVEIYEDWYFKNGEVKKADVSNREKFLIDSVFKALQIDDKYIFENTFKKVQSQEEKAIITIEAF